MIHIKRYGNQMSMKYQMRKMCFLYLAWSLRLISAQNYVSNYSSCLMQCLFMTSVINFVVADKRFLLFHFCPNKARAISGRYEGYDYAHVRLNKIKLWPFQIKKITIFQYQKKSQVVIYIIIEVKFYTLFKDIVIPFPIFGKW